MRAVIYARFSTDLQDERSIADQVALCSEYAQRQGHAVTAIYEDASASGASLHGRPAIMRLLAEAARGSFDLVLAESMSRVGRDQEDRAAIRKRLSFHGIAIATPTDGVVTPLVDGIRAVIDSQQLEDLKHHTRRGMRARVHEGRSAGGRAYGYDVLPPEPDGHGNFKRGARRINQAEAAIVRRIFQDYVAGSTPREIAKALNAERVPPPRGRSWNASTINGNRKRGNGLLLNPLYAGKLVWNKVMMPKDPATGKRVIRPNPKSAWVTQSVPDLAIVPEDLFEAAQQRKAARAVGHPVAQRRPRHLLSGLLRCATCGSGMSAFGMARDGRRRVRCSAHNESGSCPDNHTFYADVIEKTVLAALRAELRAPAVLTEYVNAYHAERTRLAADVGKRQSRIARRIAEIDREVIRLTDGIAKGHGDPAILGTRMKEVLAEKQGLTVELAEAPAAKQEVALHPGILARYEAQLERFAEAIAAGVRAGDHDGFAAVRELIESVIVQRDPARQGGVQVTITGRLNAVLGEKAYPNGVCGKGVAGARYIRKKQAILGDFVFAA
jgi:site-specific DNA recombinase